MLLYENVILESAYVYAYDGGNGWSEEQILLSSDWEAGDKFGGHVAVNGHIIAVGAANDDNEKGTDAGNVNCGLERLMCI